MFNFLKGSGLSQDQAYNELQINPQIKVIDVRTRDEYRSGHIPNSLNVDVYGAFATNIAKVCPDHSQRIFIVCESGARASSAVSFMKKAGYTDVHSIGGMASWRYSTTRK
jgi:rhodanese-related sulfurtransferase